MSTSPGSSCASSSERLPDDVEARSRGIDHVVVAVRELERASADYERAGFTVTPGGEHASGDTRNALVSFADGSYLELIAFREPDRPRQHPWWRRLARGEGVVDFALAGEKLASKADALRTLGLDVEGPIDGGRTRPDGQRLVWRTILVSDSARTPLPFVIEDVTPRSLRVPGGSAAEHRLGITGIDGIVLVVADLARSIESFEAITGTVGGPAPRTTAGVRRMHLFPVGNQWIELAEPDESASEIRHHLERRGAGPFELALRSREARGGDGRLLPIDIAHGARIRISD